MRRQRTEGGFWVSKTVNGGRVLGFEERKIGEEEGEQQANRGVRVIVSEAMGRGWPKRGYVFVNKKVFW